MIMTAWHREFWRAESPRRLVYRWLGVLLAPLEWIYRLAVAARNRAYDRNWRSSVAVAIPALGVGNLTVGGTGKTPIAAWFASEFRARGNRPGIVLRGYGADEVSVHRVLNPSVPVFASPDRVAGARRAREAGCDLVVLDDAFQHRRIRTDAHVVLIAVEEWDRRPRLLPRGPWREPPSALVRASLILLVRKTACPSRSEAIEAEVAEAAPGVPRGRLHLKIGGLARYDTSSERLEDPERPSSIESPLALAGVARPETVRDQLQSAGARYETFRSFPDHHRYSPEEVRDLRAAARDGPLIMTLKDAVKLGPALDPTAEIYVALQEIEWESGEDAVSALIGRVRPGGTDR